METVAKLTDLESKYGKLTPNGMLDRDYPKEDNVRFLRFAGGRCPICGSDHWCQINATGTKVVCQREKIENQVVNGFKYKFTIKSIDGYVYELVDSKQAVKFDGKLFQRQPTFPLASASHLDVMNRLVLAAYPLTKDHRANLLKRGLTDEDINLHGDRGFGSFYLKNENGKPYFVQAKAVPNENGEAIYISRWKKVLKKFGLPADAWHGVPGFSTQVLKLDGKVLAKFPIFASSNLVDYNGNPKKHIPEGMLVPYYDEYNRLVGFQIRIDNPKKYALIEKPLKRNKGRLKVFINKDDSYTVKLVFSGWKEDKVIAKGNLNGAKRVNLSYGVGTMKEDYSFKVEKQAKYFWISSRDSLDGANNDGKLPIQVAYNPEIAKLNPFNKKQRQEIKSYISKPKAIWVTEGGLKGYITAAKLSKTFSKEELDKYGRDVLAVAGVNSYRKFLPMLDKLNVNTVTIAYDMDMLENDQVADNYSKLINLLQENHYKVQLAVWNPQQAKGIDDALVAKVPVNVTKY